MAGTETPLFPDSTDLTLHDRLIVVGLIAGLIVGLVILWIGFSFFLDVCILGDSASARRRLRQCRNCFCCRDEEELVDEENHDDLELVDLETLLSTLSTHEKNLLIDSILTGNVITSENLSSLDKLKDYDPEAMQDDSAGRNEPVVCSICLQEFECGQETAEAKACHHVFHRDCLRQWLTSSNNHTACPYCRAALITAADVKRTLHESIDSS